MNTAPHTNQLPRFIMASGMTNLADGIAVVVWAWIATLLTRDPILVALMPVALRLPWFLFALPAGIITDRVDRHHLILAMDIVRAVAFGAAAFIVWASLPLAPPLEKGTAMPTLFLALLGCAVLVGTAEVFRDNAAQTMLPAIVPHDQLERANGRLWSVELVGNSLLGPALGAFLIASVIWLPFALNAGAFVIAALLIVGLKGNFAPVQKGPRDWRKELGQGVAFLRDAPLLRLLAITTGVWNLLHQMVVIALVLYVQEALGLEAWGYGLILAAGAVGGIMGGFVADRVVKMLGQGAAAQWMTLASAVAFAAIPFAPNGIALALVLAAFEFTGIIWNTVSVSYRQRVIPDELLGRVNSVYRLLAWGMMPIGLLLSGMIVSGSETIMSRDVALIMPFVAAAIGAAILTLCAWKPLGVGFALASDGQPR
ncbi:MFS transporter [Sulfitobacter sp. SK012]|uniref:MFS transporter n=1 Tax=Sulfitobacter sp. SK012 TaxID=1389005 RepID=UPI000E0B63A1|nr:MFS transporter [Sulfitobacter sp. SK012]AXI47169.1 MFS transporter [Sulfitobacter sp. SK012]